MAEKSSTRFSFKGYSLLEWLKANKNNVKLLIAVAVGFATPLSPQWQALVGIVAKVVVDGIDYFVSE